jgi:hypothetical protein
VEALPAIAISGAEAGRIHDHQLDIEAGEGPIEPDHLAQNQISKNRWTMVI